MYSPSAHKEGKQGACVHTPGRRYLLLSPAFARFAFYKAELGCSQQESNRVRPKRNHCIYRDPRGDNEKN